jgi:intracellular sulfur oxidation DsrE/DsrF family protein
MLTPNLFSNLPGVAMQLRSLLVSVVVATAALPPWVHAADAVAVTAPVRQEKVIYHVNELASVREALANMTNHLAASPQVKIALLANGDGVYMLQVGQRDRVGEYAEVIEALQAKGVQFLACKNSMNKRKLETAQLVKGTETVPAGVVELARLQIAEGYAYIKP